MKQKTVFVCTECGNKSPKWMGKCTMCGKWNTMEEEVVSPVSRGDVLPASAEMPRKIKEIDETSESRQSTGMSEFDRVLGGGLVKGSFVLVGGDPGIGKSTILLQICEFLGKTSKILYVSGEESPTQIKLRAERLKIKTENLKIYSETNMNYVKNAISSEKPDIIIVDSVQTMVSPEVGSSPGSVSQIKEVTSTLMRIAKDNNISIFLVGHVTKDGAIAGPKILEHMVDTVLYFEGDNQQIYRILRAVKNRFGSTNEIGVFEMTDKGLVEVLNPSAMLLEGRSESATGSAIVCTMEGTRGVLAEIQALVTPTGFGNPRRMSDGIDFNRVILMIAVLEKRCLMSLSNFDVYINIAGGLRLDETAVDLGICAAIISGHKDISIPPDMVFIGEIGLGGELRSVSNLEKRLAEISKLGFKKAVVPKMSLKNTMVPKGLEVIGISSIKEAARIIKESTKTDA